MDLHHDRRQEDLLRRAEVPHPDRPTTSGARPASYAELFQDASLIASLQASLSQVSDAGVRGALQEGIHAATRAIQARVGEHFTIEDEAAHKA